MKEAMKKSRFMKCLLSMILAVTLFASTPVSAQANVLGIDVSRYNGTIDWSQVAASGVTYAFIRVGTTKGGVDIKFHENVLNAQMNGIRTGVYIYSYAGSVAEAVNEAHLVLQWIENYNINFPVVYDIEDSVQKKLDPNTVTAMCNAFCDVIYSAGYYPMIYTGANFYRNYITPELRYDKWIAHYAQACGIPGYDIWQASNTGKIPGVAGNVDIDYMVKDYRNIIMPYGFAQRPDGVYFYNNYRIQFGWINVGGLRFHMDALGRMQTGWFMDETGIYYLAADGHAVTGQNVIDNAGYMFNEMGAMVNGWQAVGPYLYYYNPLNGNQLQTGWFTDETGTHYLYPGDGHMVIGPMTIDNKNYFFNAEGHMQIGWQDINGLRFYYNPMDGAMVTGWLNDGVDRYYLYPADGHMLTGYVTIGKDNYFFNAEGKMQTGIIEIAGGNFYFDPLTGAMTTGFVSDGADRYYFSPMGGLMLTGLQVIDGQTYYFNEKGQMQVGLQEIGGQKYYFDPLTGTMLKGWLTTPEMMLHFSTLDGHMLANEIAMVDGVPRCFKADGTLLVNDAYTLAGVTYVSDANGMIIFPAF